MNTTFATLGLVVITSAFSICAVCESGTRSSVARGVFLPTANGASLPRSRGARPQEFRYVLSQDAMTARTATPQATEPRTVTLAVQGMTCGGCVLGTRKMLTRLPGVIKADVSYPKGTAVVTYDPSKVTVAQMIAAIRTLHYTATLVTSTAS